MIANSPAAVAAAFSNSCSPTSPGERLRRDPRADHERREEGGSQQLGEQAARKRRTHAGDRIALTNITSIDICRLMTVDLECTPKTKRAAGERCCEPVVYPDVDRERATRMAEVAKALGDPIRLQLVDVLRRHAGKVCVCELVPLFDISQPTLSHHLGKLRAAGIVDSERRGLWAYYYVIPDALQELSAWLR
jgi:ArsR family transcriptional regulator